MEGEAIPGTATINRILIGLGLVTLRRLQGADYGS